MGSWNGTMQNHVTSELIFPDVCLHVVHVEIKYYSYPVLPVSYS